MLRAVIFSLGIFVCNFGAFAQIGGKHAFEFVNLANNANLAGIGGINISQYDQDANLMFQNPALINSAMYKKLSLSYLPYFADIKGSALAYANKYKDLGSYGVGMQFMSYGPMKETDENGNDIGTFYPVDYYLFAGGSHKLGNYTLGASLKYAGSFIQKYSASALFADIGGIFRHPKKDLTVGLAFKNLGFVFDKYIKGSDMNIPFDVQAGLTYKPEHMPLRFSVTAHHLQKFDIVYLDPTVKGPVDLEGKEIKPKKTFADKVGRHFVLGGEFILSKNFNIRFGYNYLRRRELRLQTKSGGAGFSFGFMMRIKSFEFAFSRAYYSVGAGSNYLTITTDINRLFNKKKSKGAE